MNKGFNKTLLKKPAEGYIWLVVCSLLTPELRYEGEESCDDDRMGITDPEFQRNQWKALGF